MNNTTKTSEKLKKCLVEWHDFKIPPLVPRNFSRQTLDEKRIVAVIGPRRAGKTYVCFEMISDLLKHGLPRENIIYMNFEDERLVPIDGTELTLLIDVNTELYERNENLPCYCFIDEIQNVPGWSKWVRRIVDQNSNFTVVVTGSSSKMLSTEIATELRGRCSTITIFPYSFREFLHAKGSDVQYSGKLLYSAQRNSIKRNFNEYLLKGGFPGIVDLADYRDTLQAYYRTMFARDMIERFRIKNIHQFEDFLKIQISRFASLTSISNAEREMKELGYSLSKNTLMSYLGYAKDVFLLFDVCKFDNKVSRQLRAPRKIYAVDHGLLNAVRFSATEDRGRILENLVFMELRRRHTDIYYNSEKSECDFIIMSGIKATQCIQACWSIENKDTKEREIRGLLEAMHTFRLEQGTILTNDEYATETLEGKKIDIMPFWYFALQSDKENYKIPD
jgi:predicted AAA+ superfamily ATPase